MDTELYVDRVVGEGDPLVLIHGGWTDHTTWSLLVPPLSRSFRVIRYDRRGHRGADTFVDMLADPAWGELDVDGLARCGGSMLVTYGDSGPDWLPRAALTVASRIGCPALKIPGAGHTPHHTHPDALAAIIQAHAARR